MCTRISLTLTLAAATAVIAAPVAQAATAVSIASASQSGAFLVVSGTASFDDSPFTTVGTDGTDDTFVPGFGTLGGDTTAAQISTEADGDLRLRWVVSQMPQAPLDGSPTGVIYIWDFCVGESCFEVTVGRTGLLATATGPFAQLWSCANKECASGDQTFVADGYAAAFSAATKTVTVTLPASVVNAAAGVTVSPASGWSVEGPAFTDISDGSLFGLFDIGDGVPTVEDYTIPGKSISAVLAAPGLDPSSLSYGSSVAPAPSGAFSASTGTNGLTGDQMVYVRACFGDGNCAYATRAVTLV